MNFLLRLLIFILKFLKSKLSKYSYFFNIILFILEPAVLIITIKDFFNMLFNNKYINLKLIKKYIRKILNINLLILNEYFIPKLEVIILNFCGEKALNFFRLQCDLTVDFVLTLIHLELFLFYKIQSTIKFVSDKIDSIKNWIFSIFK